MENTTPLVAQGLASKGRYGDSMLVHMAPSEVAGIASLAPGEMTINPDTGLPEAFKFKDFLRIALPIAGSMVLPGMAAAGAGIGSKAMLSGVGSAGGTLLAGGDIQDALTSGITAGLGYGLGATALKDTAGGVQAVKPNGNPMNIQGVVPGPPPGPPPGPVSSNISNLPAVESGNISRGFVPKNVPAKYSPNTIKKLGGPNATEIQYISDSTTTATQDAPNLLTRFLPKDPAGNIDTQEAILRGGAGLVGGVASAPLPNIEEDDYDVDMADPWRRRVRYPGAGVGSREYGYFSPSGIYAKGGGYINDMQEGGTVGTYTLAPGVDIPDTDPLAPGSAGPEPIPTIPVDPTGLSAFAPMIAGQYGRALAESQRPYNYGAGLGSIETGGAQGITAGPVQPLTGTGEELISGGTTMATLGKAGGLSEGVTDDMGYLKPIARRGADVYGNLTEYGDIGSYTGIDQPYADLMTQADRDDLINLTQLQQRSLVSDARNAGNLYPQINMLQNRIDQRARERQRMTQMAALDERLQKAGYQEGGMVPQSEGMVDGAGDGMSDEVYGDIAGKQEVALSEGEFIIPADVVSGIGNGSSKSGAEELYEMMDRIRKARTGTAEQPPEIDPDQFMPA